MMKAQHDRHYFKKRIGQRPAHSKLLPHQVGLLPFFFFCLVLFLTLGVEACSTLGLMVIWSAFKALVNLRFVLGVGCSSESEGRLASVSCPLPTDFGKAFDFGEAFDSARFGVVRIVAAGALALFFLATFLTSGLNTSSSCSSTSSSSAPA